ncbi:MAG TPA: hypothetical protein VN213_20200 [Solirubrobacteraceae bacterium]|nr:hypothetical protein [Solirubrobacteraceae bacterium]
MSVDFGCDCCGAPEAEHTGKHLTCPGQGKHAYASLKVERHPWCDDGHRLTVVLRYGSPYPRLICPEGECRSLLLCSCREDSYQDPNPNCERCCGEGIDPSRQCWLQHVIEEIAAEWFELTPWWPEIALDNGPVPILWRGGWDDLQWRPRERQAVAA